MAVPSRTPSVSDPITLAPPAPSALATLQPPASASEQRYHAPPERLPGSILSLSSTGTGGRGSSDGNVIGDVINHGKAKYWVRGGNYHCKLKCTTRDPVPSINCAIPARPARSPAELLWLYSRTCDGAAARLTLVEFGPGSVSLPLSLPLRLRPRLRLSRSQTTTRLPRARTRSRARSPGLRSEA